MNQPDKLLYDRKSAAYALSISVRSLDYLIAAGNFQTRRIGKKVLIPASELRKFVQSNHFQPVSQPKIGLGESPNPTLLSASKGNSHG
jgi:hypothetical protein